MRVGAYHSRRTRRPLPKSKMWPDNTTAQVAASNSIREHFHRGALAVMLSKVGNQSRRRRSTKRCPLLGLPNGPSLAEKR